MNSVSALATRDDEVPLVALPVGASIAYGDDWPRASGVVKT
jgi:hypothetical protein